MLGDERLTYAEADGAVGRPGPGAARLRRRQGHATSPCSPATAPSGSSAGSATTRIGGVAVLLNTYSKARELGWLLRHSDAQVLLTVDAHLGHDYLDRLEQAVPGLADQRPERILVESHPYLRAVWTWGDGRRPWAGPVADLAAAGDGGHATGCSPRCEAEVTPADPMVVVYSSGSTADPKGAVHTHGAVRPPRPQPVADARPRRGRRALHADAAVLGGRASASP